MKPPRKVPDRDSYYMGRAFVASRRSKDPDTQVGAYIISSTFEPIASGYNGAPSDINDNEVNWERPYKRDYVHHAESNAIWWGRHKCMKDGTIYVTARPCKRCMLDIVRAKLKRVVYFVPKTDVGSMLADPQEIETTLKIASMAKIQMEEFSGNLDWLTEIPQWLEKIGALKRSNHI